MKLWSTSKVSFSSAMATPYWYNVDDVRDMLRELREINNKLATCAPGSRVATLLMLHDLIAKWEDRE